MTITVINHTSCPFALIWDYTKYPCSHSYPAGGVASGTFSSPGVTTFTAPCLSFCDGPCECPSAILIADPSNLTGTTNPWGVFSSWPGGSKNYSSFLTCSGCVTPSNPGGIIEATVSYNPSTSNTATIDIHCP